MEPTIQNTIDAAQLPEVQALAKQLASYGLGLYVPHKHDESGAFVPLPEAEVAVEEGCVVRFVHRDASVGGVPVAWLWTENDGMRVVQNCKLEYPGGPHK